MMEPKTPGWLIVTPGYDIMGRIQERRRQMKQKSKRPAHRPQRRYPDAERVLVGHLT